MTPLLSIERVKVEEKYLLIYLVFCESLFVKGCKNGQLTILFLFLAIALLSLKDHLDLLLLC